MDTGKHTQLFEGRTFVLFAAWTNIAVQILAEALLSQNTVPDVHPVIIGNGCNDWANDRAQVEYLEWKDSKDFLEGFLQRRGVKIVFATLGALNQGLATDKCDVLHGKCILSGFDEFAQVCATDS